jgi:hypothetical protein
LTEIRRNQSMARPLQTFMTEFGCAAAAPALNSSEWYVYAHVQLIAEKTLHAEVISCPSSAQ